MPSFAELGLPAPCCGHSPRAVSPRRSPSRRPPFPRTLAGRDLLGRGQTGSGKTLAFGLAMLSRLDGGRAQPRRPRGLVLVPTRELAQQVVEAVLPYAKALGLTVTSVVGGMSFNRQAAEQRGVDLLVATPAGSATTPSAACDLSGHRDHGDRRGRPDGRHGVPPRSARILDLTPRTGSGCVLATLAARSPRSSPATCTTR